MSVKTEAHAASTNFEWGRTFFQSFKKAEGGEERALGTDVRIEYCVYSCAHISERQIPSLTRGSPPHLLYKRGVNPGLNPGFAILRFGLRWKHEKWRRRTYGITRKVFLGLSWVWLRSTLFVQSESEEKKAALTFILKYSHIFVTLGLPVTMKTACFRSLKNHPYKIFSLTCSVQDISMFITFQFCRDWEFRAMKIQAQYFG
jgi:hypothetical protein